MHTESTAGTDMEAWTSLTKSCPVILGAYECTNEICNLTSGKRLKWHKGDRCPLCGGGLVRRES